MKRLLLALAMFLGVAAQAAPASADITWSLTQGGSVAPTPGSYGTITATQLGAGTVADPYHVQVTVSLVGTGELFVATGQHYGITFNMAQTPDAINITSGNASMFTVQAFNGSYTNSPATDPKANFGYAISWKGNGGSNASQNLIVFDITKSGGLVLTNSLFGSNSNGLAWSVDVIRGCTQNGSDWSCSGNTGVVAALPEPGTLAISVVGLMGLAGFSAMRRRKTVNAN